jgi:hypothetical protein
LLERRNYPAKLMLCILMQVIEGDDEMWKGLI